MEIVIPAARFPEQGIVIPAARFASDEPGSTETRFRASTVLPNASRDTRAATATLGGSRLIVLAGRPG